MGITAKATTTQECTQIGENGPSVPFWGICVHCCDVVDRRGDAGVYTDWRKWPLGAVLGHLCTLLRREPRRVARAPQQPLWCAGSAPSAVRLSPGRENRLCASDAAARLAFSLGYQPTQTPEEPLKGKLSSQTPAKAIHAHVTHHAPQLTLGLSGACVHGLPHLAHHLVHLAPLLDDLIDLLNTMA